MSIYRVGNHQPQNIYRGDDYIGVMFSPIDAADAVRHLNSPALPVDREMSMYWVGDDQPQDVYRGSERIGVMFSPVDAAAVVRHSAGRGRDGRAGRLNMRREQAR